MENAAPYRPCNYGGGGGGTVTIAEGTVHSYNTLYAQLIMRVGAAGGHGDGRHARHPQPRCRPTRPAVLGTNEVTAMDMAAAYATFANRGIRVPPGARHPHHPGRRHGAVQPPSTRQTKVLDAGVADTITEHPRAGRSSGARAPGPQLDRPAAGKTGTADDDKDAWFAGLHARARHRGVGGVPAGPTARSMPMRRPTRRSAVTGGSYPAEIWQRFMSRPSPGDRPAPSPSRPPRPRHADRTSYRRPRGRRSGAADPVPDVVGLDAAEAAAGILTAAGFQVGHRARAEGVGRTRHRRDPEPLGRRRPDGLDGHHRGRAEVDKPVVGPDEAAPVTSPPHVDAAPGAGGWRWSAARVVIRHRSRCSLAMWGYVLYLAFGPGRQAPPDRLDDPAFATEAQAICDAAHDDVDQLPRAIDAESAEERAAVIARGQRAVRDHGRRPRRGSPRRARTATSSPRGSPTGGSTSATVPAYADALRRDPEAQLLVTAKDREQITEFIDAFSADNQMIACATPIDV